MTKYTAKRVILKDADGNYLIPYIDNIKASSVNDTKDNGALTYWTGTKAEYEAIETKDENTLYNVTDDVMSTSLFEEIEEAKNNAINNLKSFINILYPVGSIYITTNKTCPLSGVLGTWELVAKDKVLQGAGTRGAVGSTLSESLPNIKASVTLHACEQSNIIANVSGAISGSGGSTTQYRTPASLGVNNGAMSYGNVDFNASRSSSTYRDNAPVQPNAYLVNIYRRIA